MARLTGWPEVCPHDWRCLTAWPRQRTTPGGCHTSCGYVDLLGSPPHTHHIYAKPINPQPRTHQASWSCSSCHPSHTTRPSLAVLSLEPDKSPPRPLPLSGRPPPLISVLNPYTSFLSQSTLTVA